MDKNLTPRAKYSVRVTVQVKTELLHMVIMPPEAPTDGM